MARLTRLRPFSVTSAFSMILREESLRRPEIFAFATGTRSIMRSCSKEMTNRSSLWPAISFASMSITRPTPWVG
jgi:hypothetical protein